MRVQKYRKQILEQTSSKSFSAPKSLAQKYRKQTSPMFLGSKIKARNLLHSQRQNHNKWIRERGSSTIIGVYSACIMEGENTLLIDDATIFQMEEDQDHERNISDSNDEDGSDSNSNDSDGVTDAEQELQNTVTIKKKKKRGLTRLPKLRTAYTNSGGKKHRVKFDQLERFTGKYRAEFPSFLGDLVREKVGISVFNWKDVKKEVRDKFWEEITVFNDSMTLTEDDLYELRNCWATCFLDLFNPKNDYDDVAEEGNHYYEIDETRRKYVMNRLGILLRSFRKRLYADHIFPNLGKPTKLAKIPRRDVSGKTKLARKESLYQHRMGRGGYSALREKLIMVNRWGLLGVEKKVIEKDEMPARSLMWYKARENKAGVLEDDNVKVIAHKLMEIEKQINDGELKLDPGTDAMTLVFGKENGGFLKGVGTGVTATRYFHVPRNKGSAKEQIQELKIELQKGKCEIEKKDDDIKVLSTKMSEQDKTLKLVLAHLASQGMVIPDLQSPPNFSPPQAITVEKNVGSEHTSETIMGKEPTKEPTKPEIAKSTKKILESKTSTIIHETPSYISRHPKIQDTPAPNSIQCSLSYPDHRNVVAFGTIYLSTKRQTFHGVPVQDDCYVVSIDKVEKGASFLPYETPEHKTVGDALKTFVAWPKYLVKPNSKVPLETSTKNNEPQKCMKRKKSYITREDILKQHTRSSKNKIKE
ncbi:hypothetical protein OROMI_005212 [Orobanche minor]